MPKKAKIDMTKLMELYSVENVISSLEKELYLIDPNEPLVSVTKTLKALKEESIDDYTSILDVKKYVYINPNALPRS